MRDSSRINRCYNDFGNAMVLLKTASKVLFRNLNCSLLYALTLYIILSCSCSILNTVLGQSQKLGRNSSSLIERQVMDLTTFVLKTLMIQFVLIVELSR